MKPHPAKFSQTVIETLAAFLPEFPEVRRVLDPFAGTGRVHELGLESWGVEIEPGWADMHPRNLVGDALHLPFRDGAFDAVITSPTYGNRMADHHNAKDASKRNTYRHVYGEDLHRNNSGTLQWGEAYRAFHREAWAECARVTRAFGLFFLNISDHIRAGEVMPVSEWHLNALHEHGYRLIGSGKVRTPRQRRGANGNLRVDHEWVYVLRIDPNASPPKPALISVK